MGRGFARSETLEIDLDGDGNSDARLQMIGLSAANRLTTMDFVWL
ncbi:MAG: hypothetical protein RIC87_19115 [Kiloniellales bacterium]